MKRITVTLTEDQVEHLKYILDKDSLRLSDREYLQPIADAIAFNKRLINDLSRV